MRRVFFTGNFAAAMVAFCLAVCGICAHAQTQIQDPYMGIIPAPASVKKSGGEFKLNPETSIFVDSIQNNSVKFLAAYLKKNGYVNTITDITTIEKNKRNIKNSINLSFDFKGDMPAEGYELDIAGDHVMIKGRGAGMFYGLQTLLQLINNNGQGYATIPCAVIKDHPRFYYRGMHLDVARHFFDVSFIKTYLDLMAAYKLNNFHWHLTDDQGWRIEIKKYPKLTEIGSKRAQTKIGRASTTADLYDNTPYGGFYTQDEIREVVKYAADRYINVIPEIDMPGHSLAAIAAYPSLSCDSTKPYKVGENWGEYTDILCPTDETFHFIEGVLREVIEMFPSKYIHIGGDEVNKTAWKNSAYCREFISQQGLMNEEGLQSYFVGRIEKFMNQQGRSIIGWDEILEGGLAPNATVMSWRGEKGGIAAAELNHDVIMTPSPNGMYFDHAQSASPQEPLSIGGNAPLAKVYNYEPVPDVLSSEKQKHILGVQANLWTEYIATPAKVEYMLLPRMIALSEVAWSEPKKKDYLNFSVDRLPRHLARLDAEGYNYRVPQAYGMTDTTVTGDQFNIKLFPSVDSGKIYYSLNGFNPDNTDLQYTVPLLITVPPGKSMDFKATVISPSGKRSVVSDIHMDNK